MRFASTVCCCVESYYVVDEGRATTGDGTSLSRAIDTTRTRRAEAAAAAEVVSLGGDESAAYLRSRGHPANPPWKTDAARKHKIDNKRIRVARDCARRRETRCRVRVYKRVKVDWGGAWKRRALSTGKERVGNACRCCKGRPRQARSVSKKNFQRFLGVVCAGGRRLGSIEREAWRVSSEGICLFCGAGSREKLTNSTLRERGTEKKRKRKKGVVKIFAKDKSKKPVGVDTDPKVYRLCV